MSSPHTPNGAVKAFSLPFLMCFDQFLLAFVLFEQRNLAMARFQTTHDIKEKLIIAVANKQSLKLLCSEYVFLNDDGFLN